MKADNADRVIHGKNYFGTFSTLLLTPLKNFITRLSMHPALIASLAALLVALIYIRAQITDLEWMLCDREYYKGRFFDLALTEQTLRAKCSVQANTINKLQTDNALLRAELKRKHRRVPVL